MWGLGIEAVIAGIAVEGAARAVFGRVRDVGAQVQVAVIVGFVAISWNGRQREGY